MSATFCLTGIASKSYDQGDLPFSTGDTEMKVGATIGKVMEESSWMPASCSKKLTKPDCRAASSADDRLNTAPTAFTLGAGCSEKSSLYNYIIQL